MQTFLTIGGTRKIPVEGLIDEGFVDGLRRDRDLRVTMIISPQTVEAPPDSMAEEDDEKVLKTRLSHIETITEV